MSTTIFYGTPASYIRLRHGRLANFGRKLGNAWQSATTAGDMPAAIDCAAHLPGNPDPMISLGVTLSRNAIARHFA